MERRARSRWPLRIILTAICLTTAIWLFDLYRSASWVKISSFLQGYFLGSFVMAWIFQRAAREDEEEPAPPAPPQRPA